MSTFLVEAVDRRPDPVGGPIGDPYVEHTRAAADERAAELANMLSRTTPPEFKADMVVRVKESDGTTIRLVAVLPIP